jgi:5-methylcytosine-specific restriction enzyme subunit McrC
VNPFDLFDHGKHGFGEDEIWLQRHWNGLEGFLLETWDNRPQVRSAFRRKADPVDENPDDIGEEGADDADTRQRYLFRRDRGLRAGRFVGTIWYEGHTINVWPRVFRNVSEALPGLMTRNLLHWCSRAGYFEGLNPGTAGSAPATLHTFFDAYLWLFANHTHEQVASQPYWQYQSQEEEGEVLRGRLLINDYTRDCLARGRWHRLVYEHEPFDFDNLLNRIIKRACRVARACTAAPKVSEILDAILFELDEVEDVPCSVADCDRVHLNRLQTGYAEVLDACRMILATAQADSSGQTGRRFCFLLPMDRLFEEYLRELADKAVSTLGDSDWRLTNPKNTFLADDGTGKRAGCFKLRHDFYFENRQTGCVIADAKWKSRSEREAKGYGNYGVSQGDMYQMVAYAHRRGCTEVHLLYPAMGDKSKNDPIATFKTQPNCGSPINVHVHELKIHACGDEGWDETEKDIRKQFCDMLKKD